MEANELIDRYIHEVGRHLPRANREDIKLELKSLLLDTIEEQTADTGQEPTTKMVAQYLLEFGKPEEIASKYQPETVLIGPKLFPYYQFVLTIVLTVVGAISLLGLIFQLIQNDITNFNQAFMRLLFSFGETALTNIGLITLIFAGLERLNGVEFDFVPKQTAEWDPYQLPPIKDPDRIDRFEVIASIFFAALFIIAFNFFYDLIGFIDLTGEDSGFIGMLAPEFHRHVPWLTASFALDGLLNIYVLAKGHWNKGTRLVQLASGVFGIFVLYRILVGGAITTVPIFTTLAKIGIIVVIIIEAIQLIQIAVRLIIGRPISPENFFKSLVA